MIKGGKAMKKTKRMLAAMLTVTTLAAALSGCSGGKKTEESIEFTEAATTEEYGSSRRIRIGRGEGSQW